MSRGEFQLRMGLTPNEQREPGRVDKHTSASALDKLECNSSALGVLS